MLSIVIIGVATVLALIAVFSLARRAGKKAGKGE